MAALLAIFFGQNLHAQFLETAGGSLSWQATTAPREVLFSAKVFIRSSKFLSPFNLAGNDDVFIKCLNEDGFSTEEPFLGGVIDLDANISAVAAGGRLTLSIREGVTGSDLKEVQIRHLKVTALKDGFIECALLDPAWVNTAPPGSIRHPKDSPPGVLYQLPGEGRYLAWLKGWKRIGQSASNNRSFLNVLSGPGYSGYWELETFVHPGVGGASPMVVMAPPVIHMPFNGAGTKGRHLLRAEVPQGLTLKWRISVYKGDDAWRTQILTLTHPDVSDLSQERMESHLTRPAGGGVDNTQLPFEVSPDGVLEWQIPQVGFGLGSPDKFWSFQMMATAVDAQNNEIVKTPYDFMLLLDQYGTNRTGLPRAMIGMDGAPKHQVTLGDWVEFSVIGTGVSDLTGDAITLSRLGALPSWLSDYSETVSLPASGQTVKTKVRFKVTQIGNSGLSFKAETTSGSADLISVSVEVLPKIEGYYVYSTSMDYLNPNNPGAYSVATAIV